VSLTGRKGSVDLDVDFSQFQVLGRLDPGDRGRVELGSSMGLARSTELGHVWFVVPQQAGRLRVEVAILAQRPGLDADWDEVIEIPFFSTRDTVIQGYDASMGTHPLGLVPRRNYRIRYSVADVAGLDDPGEKSSQRYRLQFWPAEDAAPAVLISTTTWGQFAQYNFALERAAAAAASLPVGERLDSYLHAAVSAFPRDRQQAIEGDALATLASRYFWALNIGKVDEVRFRDMVANRFSQ
jgi:hypothetical protein